MPNFTVTIVGAHYPQVLNDPKAYIEASSRLRSVFNELVVVDADANVNADEDDGNGRIVRPRSILLADTNAEGPGGAALGGPTHRGVNITQTQLVTDLGIWTGT